MIHQTITWSFFYKDEAHFTAEDLGIKEDKNAQLETYLNGIVGKFYGKYTTAGWRNLILADHFGNEHEALTRFYVLLDEFRAVSQKPNSRAIVIKLLDKGIADLAEIKAHKTDLKDILHLISSQLNTAIYGGISVWYDSILDDIFLKANGNSFLHHWLKTTAPELVFYEYELRADSDGKSTVKTLIPSNHTRKELVSENSEVLIKTFFALNEEKAQDVKEIFMAERPPQYKKQKTIKNDHN